MRKGGILGALSPMERPLSSNSHWFCTWFEKLTGRLVASVHVVALQQTILAIDIVMKLMSCGGRIGDNSPHALKRIDYKVAGQLFMDRGRKLAAKRRFIDRKTNEQHEEQNAECSEAQGNRLVGDIKIIRGARRRSYRCPFGAELTHC